MKHITVFCITAIIFSIIDLFWLGIAAWPLYNYFLAEFLRTPPNWLAASLFYTLFIVGLMIFSIYPAINFGSIKQGFIKGGLFGFFTYMTYELTNWAVIDGWPWGIVPIDILWGTLLSGSVSGLTCVIYLKFIK